MLYEYMKSRYPYLWWMSAMNTPVTDCHVSNIDCANLHQLQGNIPSKQWMTIALLIAYIQDAKPSDIKLDNILEKLSIRKQPHHMEIIKKISHHGNVQ